MKRLYHYAIALAFLVSCQPKTEQEETGNRSKFEPADGEVILFVGQELDAIGGLEDYNNGYFDHFTIPAGFTMYTNLYPGDTMFGYVNKGLDGMKFEANWGDSSSHMQRQIDDPDFKNSALAIGLSLVNHETKVAYGEHDSLIVEMGDWIKGLGNRPVFLRIGYEFDGPWNHYDSVDYKRAFRRIHDLMDSMQVENVAYIWQSMGWGTSEDSLMNYYPGDGYVDWCAFSYFDVHAEFLQNVVEPMINIAKARDLPIFIAESTPMVGLKGPSESTPMSMAVPEEAEGAWDEWFVPFFKLIDKHPETIKAISYINANWKAHRMWQNNTPFASIDARIQLSPTISEKWKSETGKARYLKSRQGLFEYLWQGK